MRGGLGSARVSHGLVKKNHVEHLEETIWKVSESKGRDDEDNN